MPSPWCRAFALAFSVLHRRIALFLSLPIAKLDAMGLQGELGDIGHVPAP
jgi:hypothetical protein